MKAQIWTVMFLALGLALLGATLSSHDWVREAPPRSDYHWGLQTVLYCEDSDCRSHDIDSQGIKAWETFASAGPFVFYLGAGGVLFGLCVLVMHLRAALGKGNDAPAWVMIMAALMLFGALVIALVYVANRPSTGIVGWAYPAFLHGIVLTLVGLWSTGRKAAA